MAIFNLLKDVAIPEIATLIRNHAAANHGEIPTDAQILATFEADWKRSAAAGQAFLDATAPEQPQ